MEISDIRVRLVKDTNDRLKAVCSVTLDEEFVVRDVKVVEGTHGLFVAMPSRKLSVPCSKCRTQNHLRARHCNECGGKLPPARIPADADGREKAHRDIAHPITSAFRQAVQTRVLDAYRSECEEFDDEGQTSDTGDSDASDTGPSDVDTNDEKLTEYDTLIGDLKGRRDEPRGREQAERSGGGGRRGGGERGDRGGRRRGGPTRDDEQRPVTDGTVREEVAAAPAEVGFAVPEPTEPAGSERHADDDDAVSEIPSAVPRDGLRVEECCPASSKDNDVETCGADEPGPSDAASQPPPSDEDSDKGTAFGAGIL